MFAHNLIKSAYLNLYSRYALLVAFSRLATCLILEPYFLLETSIINSYPPQSLLINAFNLLHFLPP